MDENLTAAAAGIAPLAPPLDWFTMEEPDEPTPLTVTVDGQIFGHAALWPTCHTGFQGKCVQPPKSPSGYSYFHLGQVLTAEGEPVAVGKITMDTGHANIAAGAQTALSHYDNTGTTAAYVRARDGKHGIWVSGAVRSDAPAEKAAMLRGSSVSGDWRRPRPGSPLEMIGLLAVNVPGFPVPRSQALTAAGDVLNGDLGDEELFAMVAAGFVEPVALTDEQVLRKLEILEARAHGLDFLADLVFAPEELAMRALSAATGKPMAMCGSCKKMVASGAKCPECGARMKTSPWDKMKAGKAGKNAVVSAAGWDPLKHPREPAGSRGGGQWASKPVLYRHGGTEFAVRNDAEHAREPRPDGTLKPGPIMAGPFSNKTQALSALKDLKSEADRYPSEEGGHRRGWGMGPAYKLKDDQQVGRPGGVSHARKAGGGSTSTMVTRSAGKIRKSGL